VSRAKPTPTSFFDLAALVRKSLALALALAAPAALAQQGDAPKPADPPASSWIKDVKPAPKKKKTPPAATPPEAAAPKAAATPAVPAAPAAAPSAPAAKKEPAAPAPSTQSPPVAPPAPAPPPLTTTLAPAPPAASDDFDLLAPAPVLDAAQLAQAKVLEEKLATRRTMLGVHQVAGFVNLAGVTAAVVLGQLNYNDKYGGGGDTEKYIKPHAIAAYGSAAIFTATGLLALLAPSPIDQPTRLSTATVHKTCMAVATAGMVAQVVLGIVAAGKQGNISQRDYALAHQVIGYTTAVATAGGFIAITW
jgi:hypothetical protein